MTVLKSSLEYEIFAVITPMCVFVCHGQWSVVEHLGNNICLLTGYFVVLMSQEHFLHFNLQLICSIIFSKKGLFKSLSLIFLHSFSGQFQFLQHIFLFSPFQVNAQHSVRFPQQFTISHLYLRVGHCESKLSYPGTQHNHPDQGSNPGLSIWLK